MRRIHYKFLNKFLDKIAGKEFEENMSPQQNVSQLLTSNSFTWVSKVSHSGMISKQIYSEIHWNEFQKIRTYSLDQTEKYIKCGFNFGKKVKLTYSSKEVGKEEKEIFTSQKKYEFYCFILAKDKEAFLKVVEDWKEERNK